MRKFVEQFKNLNMRDPGVWPMGPKAALMGFLFVSLIGAAYFADWQGGLEELDAGRAKETQLKEEYRTKMMRAVSLDLYRKRLVEIDNAFGVLLRQLPDRSEVAKLVVDVNQAGISKGLQFDLFRPSLEENKKEFYAELPISIKVSGDYHRLGEFASEIAQLPRIVTLNDMVISVNKDTGNLSLEATAKTFRYLDDEELSEQKKAAQNAKAKKGAK